MRVRGQLQEATYVQRCPEIQVVLGDRVAKAGDWVFIAQYGLAGLVGMVFASPFYCEGKASGNPLFMKDIIGRLGLFCRKCLRFA